MTRTLLLPLFATVGLLVACDTGITTTPPGPGPAPQTRVIGVRLDPDTVAALDTVLIHVLIEDSLDTRFRYLWGFDRSFVLPVDGRLDGPRIRFIAPRTSTTPGRVANTVTSVTITNDVPGTRPVRHSFSIPIRN
ncbi:MAG: hypothetical protein AAFQ43_12980 [Bacteroidota bacterium]